MYLYFCLSKLRHAVASGAGEVQGECNKLQLGNKLREPATPNRNDVSGTASDTAAAKAVAAEAQEGRDNRQTMTPKQQQRRERQKQRHGVWWGQFGKAKNSSYSQLRVQRLSPPALQVGL